jgi:enoyl-[acyl-carrier protein] reductase II
MGENPVCHLFGIRYPIVQGGMLGISCPELAAAISNAGGLGMLSGVKPVSELRAEIRRTVKLTDKPFGVNLPMHDVKERAVEIAGIIAEEGVKVVATSAGSPQVCTKLLKDAGLVVMHVVSEVAHAIAAEAAGVDVVVASGVEAGGFVGRCEITTLVLVPQVVDAVKIPVIAAGGIADARGFVAVLALGAQGIQMGTRFIATRDCPVAADYKQAIVTAKDNSTEIVGRGQAPVRCFRTESPTAKSSNSQRPYPAGQVAGLIRDIPTVDELINSLVKMSTLISNQRTESLSQISP